MSSSSTRTWATVAAVTALGGFVAYAIYFDNKRRTDPSFRRKLQKQKRLISRESAKASEPLKDGPVSQEDLRAALRIVRGEQLPPTNDGKEQYFMQHVSIGEQLATQGPAFYLPAALSFYRALRVYPVAAELIMIYQKTVPPPIFNIIMEMTSLDVIQKVRDYSEVFPPSSMNVRTKQAQVGTNGAKHQQSVLYATKDFAPGDVIYKEKPMAAALDLDLQSAGTNCTYCFKVIEAGHSILVPDDPLHAAYCSQECQVASAHHSHNILFSLNPAIPPELNPVDQPPPAPPSEAEQAARKASQEAFIAHVKGKNEIFPLLVLRFIARMFVEQTQKVVSIRGSSSTPTVPAPDLPEPDSKEGNSEYSFYDHVEPLKYHELTADAVEKEMKLAQDVLEKAVEGLTGFVTDEQYALFKGKVVYNAFGVCFSGGRDDRPASTARPEDLERTRTPYGTTRQIGAAFYRVSSHLTHSCTPNAQPSFLGTTELQLVADKPIKTGETITISYVDSTQHPDESAVDARRRRRMELARGWGFACECEKCEGEKQPAPVVEQASDELEGVTLKEAKLEKAVERFHKKNMENDIE